MIRVTTADGQPVTSVSSMAEVEGLRAIGLIPADAVLIPPPPSADDVRAEAGRRMQALFGARDADHLAIKIANASREAIRLLRVKADRAWTMEEAARAATLEWADTATEAIRMASNALEATVTIPMDYTNDRYWPEP